MLLPMLRDNVQTVRVHHLQLHTYAYRRCWFLTGLQGYRQQVISPVLPAFQH